MKLLETIVLIIGGLALTSLFKSVCAWGVRTQRMRADRARQEQEREHIERLWQRAPLEMHVMQHIGGLPKEARRRLVIEESATPLKDQDQPPG